MDSYSSGQAPFLQMWEICLVGAMTVPADSYANEGFRVKPMAGWPQPSLVTSSLEP